MCHTYVIQKGNITPPLNFQNQHHRHDIGIIHRAATTTVVIINYFHILVESLLVY